MKCNLFSLLKIPLALAATELVMMCSTGMVVAYAADSAAIENTAAVQYVEDKETDISGFVNDKPALWDANDEERLLYNPSSDWDDVNLQITGTYYTLPAEKILEQINGYRREACEEGLIVDGKSLTMEDYHPLKWSRVLEESVRIRAMESSVIHDHQTLSGKGSWNGYVPDDSGLAYLAENLAWTSNHSNAGLSHGIELFYEEKEEYLKELKGEEHGETGHYLAMIEPSLQYVGVAACDTGNKWLCVAMQLGAQWTPVEIDESKNTESGAITKTIPVANCWIRSAQISGSPFVPKGGTGGYTVSGSIWVINNVYKADYSIPAGFDSGITWKSSDPSVVTVDKGIASGIKGGTATISADIYMHTVEQEVTVSVPINSISLRSDSLNGGNELDGLTFDVEREDVNGCSLDVICYPEDASDLGNPVFSSSDKNVATVDDNGVITVKKPGTVTISATVETTDPNAPSVSAGFTLNIISHITSVKLNNTDVVLNYTGTKAPTKQLSVTVFPTDTTDDKSVVWQSNDENVATVDENGLVSAVSGGGCVITAKAGAFTASCNVKVVAPLKSIDTGITEKRIFTEDDTDTLTVSLTPLYTSDKDIIFTSSDPSVFMVSDGVSPEKAETQIEAVNGRAEVTLVRITAASGSAALTVSAEGSSLKKTVDVKVVKATDDFVLKKDGSEVLDRIDASVGDRIDLTVEAFPLDAFDNSVKFESLNESVARIERQSGSSVSISACGRGEAVIVAVNNNAKVQIEKSFKIVSDYALSKLSFSRNAVTLYKDDVFKLETITEPEDMAANVSYESDNEDIAVVDENGSVTAKGVGIAKITATSGDKKAYCNITVKGSDVLDTDSTFEGEDKNGLWVAKESFHSSVTYTGKAVTQPDLRVYYNNRLLKEKTDYTLTYKNNIKAAGAEATKAPQVIVTLKGSYQGKRVYTYSILPADISSEAGLVSEQGQLALNVNGKDQKPVPELYLGSIKLKKITDFIVDYPDTEYSTVGKHTVTVTGAGNYTGSRIVEFYISDKSRNLSKASVTVRPSDDKDKKIFFKDGITKDDLNITVKIGTDQISPSCYEVTDLPVSVGSHTITIRASSGGESEGYHGSKRVKIITYADRDIKDAVINGFADRYVFSQSKVNQGGITQDDLSLSFDGSEMTAGSDYTLKYSGNTKVGTAKLTIKGLGRYKGSVTKTYKIDPCTDGLNVTYDSVVNYVKGGVVPSVTVTDAYRNVLDPKTAYSVSVLKRSNTKPGTMMMKVTGKGNYKGYFSDELSVEIKNGDISNGRLILTDKPYTTSKNGWKSPATVYDINGKVLTKGKDYDKNLLYYYSGMNEKSYPDPGTVVYVTAVGTGDYSGSSITSSYRIFSKSISKLNFAVDDMVYTGDEIRPQRNTSDIKGQIHVYATAKDAKSRTNELLKSSTEVGSLYTIVDYTSNVKVGTGKITIRGRGKYGGTKVITFKIKKRIFQLP